MGIESNEQKKDGFWTNGRLGIDRRMYENRWGLSQTNKKKDGFWTKKDGGWVERTNKQVCIHVISRNSYNLCPPCHHCSHFHSFPHTFGRLKKTRYGPTDRPTNGLTDGRTHPLIESWVTTKKMDSEPKKRWGLSRTNKKKGFWTKKKDGFWTNGRLGIDRRM